MSGTGWKLTVLTAIAAMALAVCTPVGWAAGGPNPVKEVQKLLKAEVGEEVVLAYIAKEGAPGTLTADEIVDLKKAGATPAVLLALLGGKTVADGDFPFDLDKDHEVNKPVVHKLMAVYPILRKAPTTVGAYLTLEEATQQKIITVQEKGGGSVPVVVIVNTGKAPVYISAGEIIIGGKQDRVVAHDILIKPGVEVTVDVRCVEQGRWHGAQQTFAPAGYMAGRKTKMEAQFGDQSGVWREVAAQNSAVGAAPASGTFRAAAEKSEVQNEYKEYADAILPKLEGRHLVGVVIALNGKIHSIEIFGAPGLFAKMKDKILKAAVLDASGMRDEGATPPGKKQILAFYESTMKEQAAELKRYSDNANRARKGADATANESLDADGAILHRSVLAH